jgi:hypothetical protein
MKASIFSQGHIPFHIVSRREDVVSVAPVLDEPKRFPTHIFRAPIGQGALS